MYVEKNSNTIYLNYVSISKYFESLATGRGFHCGGALIHKDYVLTGTISATTIQICRLFLHTEFKLNTFSCSLCIRLYIEKTEDGIVS